MRDLAHVSVMSAPPLGSDIRLVAPGEARAVIDVLCEAFAAYPVMRYVLGGSDGPDDPRLRRLVEFFAMTRMLRDEPVLGVGDDGDLVGVATVSFPGARESPAALAMLREAVWEDLGTAALARYETCGRAWSTIGAELPHVHLNMLGIRPAFQGRGLARRLLDNAQEISRATDGSAGVMLLTETRRNVALYEHVGYEIVGHARISPELESWGLFRRN